MQNQCNLNVRSKCILNALRIRKGNLPYPPGFDGEIPSQNKVNLINLLFLDDQYQTGRSDSDMFEIRWQVFLSKPGFHCKANATTTAQKQSDYKVEKSSFTPIALFSLEICHCCGRNWPILISVNDDCSTT